MMEVITLAAPFISSASDLALVVLAGKMMSMDLRLTRVEAKLEG